MTKRLCLAIKCVYRGREIHQSPTYLDETSAASRGLPALRPKPGPTLVCQMINMIAAQLRALHDARYPPPFTVVLRDGEAVRCHRVLHIDDWLSPGSVVLEDMSEKHRTFKLSDIAEVRIG